MTARIYIRVSTEEQKKKGHSPAAQREDLSRWCAEEAWGMPVIYDDSGFSGKDEDRPALRRLIADIRQGDIVLATYPDRLHRNTEDQLRFLRVANETGVAVRFLVIRNIDPTTPEGGLIVTNLASIAEYLLRDLKQKTKRGVTKARDEGMWVGHLPEFFVVRKEGDVRYVEPSPAARDILAYAGAHGVYRAADRYDINANKVYRLRRAVTRWDEGTARGVTWRQRARKDVSLG